MTTKTVFGIKDASGLNEKIASRVVSLQSVYKQQMNEVDDINKQIQNLDSTFDNLEYLYNRLTKSLRVIMWAAKEMIIIMNVLCMQYHKYLETNQYGGQNQAVSYPDKWVWNRIYRIYAPYIPGGIY